LGVPAAMFTGRKRICNGEASRHIGSKRELLSFAAGTISSFRREGTSSTREKREISLRGRKRPKRNNWSGIRGNNQGSD